MHDPIALAVPVFFLLIGIELAWAKKRGVRVYRFNDALTDLSCGVSSQIVIIFWAALQLAIYAFVYEHARLITLADQGRWVPWVVAFIGVDFLYYWWHRLSHEVNFLWAAHVVHHQSEDYNLAVALRQSVITSWTALPFYLPLAILGVPTLVFAIVHALSTIYQFWIHTELVGKMRGPIDWIVNLPSHHRVHHAINPQYLDKNYGATLVIWDRLFGTYEEEVEKPVYGITKPLSSFNPIWAQVHYWFEMADMTRAAQGFGEKARVWIASPKWKPTGYVVEGVPPITSRTKYDHTPSRGRLGYVAVQFTLVLAQTFFLMMYHRVIPHTPLVMGSVSVLGGLLAFGALIEGKPWGPLVEAGRLVVFAGAILAWIAGY
jgi:alkylglycerol monooxygenase